MRKRHRRCSTAKSSGGAFEEDRVPADGLTENLELDAVPGHGAGWREMKLSHSVDQPPSAGMAAERERRRTVSGRCQPLGTVGSRIGFQSAMGWNAPRGATAPAGRPIPAVMVGQL